MIQKCNFLLLVYPLYFLHIRSSIIKQNIMAKKNLHSRLRQGNTAPNNFRPLYPPLFRTFYRIPKFIENYHFHFRIACSRADNYSSTGGVIKKESRKWGIQCFKQANWIFSIKIRIGSISEFLSRCSHNSSKYGEQFGTNAQYSTYSVY